ncbi:hypothetical protein BMS3Bbin02_00490 [bacterium BMS3Bbin02]|nr:hypothetical protein BMS3Bbin02_00490 [bacterium BMS3Bbin02]
MLGSLGPVGIEPTTSGLKVRPGVSIGLHYCGKTCSERGVCAHRLSSSCASRADHTRTASATAVAQPTVIRARTRAREDVAGLAIGRGLRARLAPDRVGSVRGAARSRVGGRSSWCVFDGVQVHHLTPNQGPFAGPQFGELDGHPSVLEPLAAEPDVVRSGASAAADHGADVMASDFLEAYVPEARIAAMINLYDIARNS